MFHIYTGLLGLYLFWRLVWPTRWPAGVKFVLALFLLAIAANRLLVRLAFGDMFSPELPGSVLVTLGWLYGTLLFLALTLLLWDITWPLRRFVLRRRSPLGERWKLALTVGAMALSGYGVSQALVVPQIRTLEVRIDDLPAAFDGYRLVQLTDLHISPMLPGEWATKVVERTNALKADAIVATGDLIDGYIDVRHQDVEPLAGLKAVDGVYVIPGNHEYYFGMADWMDRYHELGMRVLINDHARIARGTDALTIAGINDRAAASYGETLPDIDEALGDTPADAAIVLLSHRPEGAALNARKGVDLQLSGHTHGGMIRGFDLLVARANEGFVSGLYQVGKMQLYVSNGTGLWNGFPFRLGRPAEITQFILRPAGAKAGTAP